MIYNSFDGNTKYIERKKKECFQGSGEKCTRESENGEPATSFSFQGNEYHHRKCCCDIYPLRNPILHDHDMIK